MSTPKHPIPSSLSVTIPLAVGAATALAVSFRALLASPGAALLVATNSATSITVMVLVTLRSRPYPLRYALFAGILAFMLWGATRAIGLFHWRALLHYASHHVWLADAWMETEMAAAGAALGCVLTWALPPAP